MNKKTYACRKGKMMQTSSERTKGGEGVEMQASGKEIFNSNILMNKEKSCSYYYYILLFIIYIHNTYK